MAEIKKLDEVFIKSGLLTANAKNLTTKDMEDLRAFASMPSEKGKSEELVVNDFAEEKGLKITVEDVHSVQDAYYASIPQGVVTDDTACCCTCTPCCTC